MIGASAVRDAAPFYRGRIMGGVLRAETDALFPQSAAGLRLAKGRRGRVHYAALTFPLSGRALLPEPDPPRPGSLI